MNKEIELAKRNYDLNKAAELQYGELPKLKKELAAEEAIAAVDPDYEPWAESLIELPGGETESLLFCLQTALGAIVIGYGFGYLVARKKYSGKAK